jgi:DNA-binding transcriptional MocR family regulator
MGATMRKLSRIGLTPWIEPRGFIWARLPDRLQAADVARSALAEGMVLAPGDAFSLSKAASNFLRFNVAQCSDPKMVSILSKAMDDAAGM